MGICDGDGVGGIAGCNQGEEGCEGLVVVGLAGWWDLSKDDG